MSAFVGTACWEETHSFVVFAKMNKVCSAAASAEHETGTK